MKWITRECPNVDRIAYPWLIARFIGEVPVFLYVRAADSSSPELAKEAAGLLAISQGLPLKFEDDHGMLRHGMVVYDALYAWCADTPLNRAARLPGL